MKHLFSLILALIAFHANAQYQGEAWLSNGDTLRGQIHWYMNQPKIELVQDETTIEISTPQLVGFKLTDQYFYEKPVYKFYMTKRDLEALVYRVFETGKAELLFREKEWYVYQNKNITHIRKKGDLWNILGKYKQDVKSKMKVEFWHWKLDIDKIIKYYNQIN